MAAMATARTGLEVESLKAALAVARGDHLRYPLTECKGETIHVFEDSASSLRAVTRAVELLNRQGLGLHLVRHGIAPAGSAKWETLAQAADVVHEDVNEGLEQVLP
jgi:N-acyl-D-aspartate/D-glutamate deacylase